MDDRGESPATLRGTVVVRDHQAELFDVLEEHVRRVAAEAIAARGVFHLALSGGGTPRPFYKRLAELDETRELSWQQTHVWLVDERCVGLYHEQSNWRMISESLVDHVAIEAENVHPMPVLAKDPAGEYEAELETVFRVVPEDGVPRMDFVLLGMGNDAHTASLFPGSKALDEYDRWVSGNDGAGVVPPPRLTMTFLLLNRAREVAVLACGEAKAETLRLVAAATSDPDASITELPIIGIDPESEGGSLFWYLDRDAAG